jgi:hypothetical protein
VEEFAGEFRVSGPNILGLVQGPIVGDPVLLDCGPCLEEDGLGVGAMAEDGGDGHQHGQHAHGEGDGTEGRLVLAVFGVFLQFLGFVGFHGDLEI